MATHSSILTWRIPMDRGAWQAAVRRVARVGHDWATKHTRTSWVWNQRETTSLVVHWIRVCLPIQETGSVPGPRRSDMPQSNQARGPHHWARMLQLLKPVNLEPVLHNRRSAAVRSPSAAAKSSPRSLRLEKAYRQQRRPSATKTTLINFLKRN